MRTDRSREQVAMRGLRMQVARPVMDAECNGYSRYSKWAGSPWRNHTEGGSAASAKSAGHALQLSLYPGTLIGLGAQKPDCGQMVFLRCTFSYATVIWKHYFNGHIKYFTLQILQNLFEPFFYCTECLREHQLLLFKKNTRLDSLALKSLGSSLISSLGPKRGWIWHSTSWLSLSVGMLRPCFKGYLFWMSTVPV